MLVKSNLFAKKYWPIATRFASLFGVAQNYGNIKRAPEILTCQIVCQRSITTIQQEFSKTYRSFGYRQHSKDSFKLLDSKRHSNLYNAQTRSFIFGRNRDSAKKRKKRIPNLILVQNPFTWLMNKIDFGVLKYVWDPDFQEKEFKFGTKQAISRVTQVISHGQYSELNGLLTKAARLSLLRELDRNWGIKQRALLALKHEDIQISSPRKVYFIRIGDKKFCDVDMAFLALKWTPINSIESLLFTEIFARFHREYTPHCIPEWTIAYFKVTRFEVLRR
ncbi:unnamed protein product, partial [Brenthis ino]